MITIREITTQEEYTVRHIIGVIDVITRKSQLKYEIKYHT